MDQDFKLIGNTVHVSKINSTHFFTINKKVISFLPKFTVTFDDGRIIYINAKFSFFKKSIEIYSDFYLLHLKGNFLDHDFKVNINEKLIVLFVTLDYIRIWNVSIDIDF